MANEGVVLTHQGIKELEEKFKYLKTVRRLSESQRSKRHGRLATFPRMRNMTKPKMSRLK